MTVALVSTAAGSVGATAAASLQWLFFAIYFGSAPPDLSVASVVTYLVLVLWAAFFVLMHYLLLMILAGLPVLLIVARLHVGNFLVALAAGILLTTAASIAYFNVVTSHAMEGLIGLAAYQILPGAASGISVWFACRQVLRPRPAPPS